MNAYVVVTEVSHSAGIVDMIVSQEHFDSGFRMILRLSSMRKDITYI